MDIDLGKEEVVMKYRDHDGDDEIENVTLQKITMYNEASLVGGNS